MTQQTRTYTKEKTLNDVKLILPYQSYRKVMEYAVASPGEITGFAEVEFDKENYIFRMGEVYLLKQECTSADVEMDDDALDAFNDQLIEQGVTQLPRLWWHSHNDFNVFFSGTDENTITYLAHESYVVALVVNKKRQMYAKARINGEVPFVIEPLKVEVDYEDFQISSDILQEVKEKVSQKSFSQLPHSSNSGSLRKIIPQQGEYKSAYFPGYTVCQLPTRKDDAIDFLYDNDLIREVHDFLKCFVYKDEVNMKVYYDYKGLLDDVPFTSLEELGEANPNDDPDWVKGEDDNAGKN